MFVQSDIRLYPTFYHIARLSPCVARDALEKPIPPRFPAYHDVHRLIRLGSLLTTWVTFTPCFLWIFLGAPYVEALSGNRTIHAALSAITAAVVGVILNLSVWFAVHTIFHSVQMETIGLMRVDVPVWSSVDLVALFLQRGRARGDAALQDRHGAGRCLSTPISAPRGCSSAGPWRSQSLGGCFEAELSERLIRRVIPALR